MPREAPYNRLKRITAQWIVDKVTGIENVGFGPVVELETICNKCDSVCTKQFGNHSGCDTCDSWGTDVRYRSLRMFSDVGA